MHNLNNVIWHDAEFIAHARQDVPALLAAVESVLALHLDLDSNTRYMNPAWINGWEAATQAVRAAITTALEAS